MRALACLTVVFFAVPSSMLAVLDDDPTTFARAIAPRNWEFPRDHGAHPEFQTEWWYATGNLAGTGGAEFGYQFTIFRRALTPLPPSNSSTFATRDVYLAHVALSDITAGNYYHAQMLRRPAAGMAGASTTSLQAWVGPFRIDPEGDGARIQIRAADFACDLHLRPAKPIVFHGEGGLDQKGSAPGQASYYHSMTRLNTTGTVTVGGRSVEVAGLSWLDKEFGSNTLGVGQVGWDWFSLQFDDGTELMLYGLRLSGGGYDAESGGTFVGADGATQRIGLKDFAIDPLATWRSPRTGANYPARWRIRVPAVQLDIEVTPRMPDQEMTSDGDSAFSYYEGSVAVTGMRAGVPVTALGYVELAGYARPMTGRF